MHIAELEQEFSICALGTVPPSRLQAMRSGFQQAYVGDTINGAIVAESFQYPDHLLRLFILCDEPSVSALPWELLEVNDDGMNIVHRGSLAGHPMGRICRLSSLKEPNPVRTVTLRVLVIESNPGDAGYPLLAGVGDEVASILEETARAGERVEARHLFQPSRDQLFAAIEEFKPHIVHYAGHADYAVRSDDADPTDLPGQHGSAAVCRGLILSHPTTRTEQLDGRDFARHISANGVRLVVLSGCVTGAGSHGLCGDLMARGVKSVVSMQANWPDACGRYFARDFYQALFSGADLCDAVHRARIGLRPFGMAQFLPVLTLNGPITRPLDWSPGSPFIVPYTLSKRFVGRDVEFDYLWKKIVTEGESVCVTGMSGTGKSLLASQFCHRAQSEFPGGIYWINATDNISVDSSLSEIADGLGLAESGSAAALKRAVFQRLHRIDKAALIVLDNLESETKIELPRSSHLHYLATIKSRHFPTSVPMVELSLPVLSVDESTRYLSRLLDVNADEVRQDVEQICSLIGSMPITLANTAAHIRSLGVSLADYAQRLSRRPLEPTMPPRGGTSGDTSHDGNILHEIEGNVCTLTPLAGAVLCATACLSSSGIPRSILRGAFSDSEVEDVDDALEELSDRHLIHYESGNRVGVHELVQHYIRQSGSSESGFAQVVPRLTLELNGRLRSANERMDWRELWPLLPHCRKLSTFARDIARESWRDLLEQEATARFEMGEARMADDLLEMCDEDWASTPGVLDAQIRLQLKRAEIQADLEEYDTAVITAERLIETAGRSLQPNAPEWIDILCSQGYSYKARRSPGDLARALRCYTKAIRVARRNYGEKHSSMANCQNFIGNLYESAGQASRNEGKPDRAARRFKSALTFLRSAFEIDAYTYGTDHVSTALKRNNCARALRLNGDIQAALEQHFRARDVFLRQSERFQEIPWTDFHISICLIESGNSSTAREYLHRARSRFVEMYGAESGPVRRVDEKLKLLSEG